MQTSCGFGVPLLATAPTTTSSSSDDDDELTASTGSGEVSTRAVLRDRDTLGHWAHRQIEKDSLLAYQAKSNSSSLDGCPGLRSAMRRRGQWVRWELVKARVRRVVGQREAVAVGVVMGVVLVLGMQIVLGGLGVGWEGLGGFR